MRTALVLSLFAFLLTACDSSRDYTVGGSYVGSYTFTEGGAAVTVETTFVLPDVSDGETFAFTSTAEITVDQTVTETASGTGSYSHPTLTLTADGTTLSGTVSDDGQSFTLQQDSQPVVFRR